MVDGVWSSEEGYGEEDESGCDLLKSHLFSFE